MEAIWQSIPAWFWGVLVFVLGACWGSFLNVCIWRMPRELSLIRPGSRCGSCQAPIPWYHNIPLVSYFVLGGRCGACGAEFSFRYWLVEFLNAALWLLLWRQYVAERGWLVVLAYCLLVSLLLVGTFIDFDFYIIPDRITLGSLGAGLVLSLAIPALHRADSHWQSLQTSLLGATAGGLALWLIVELGKMAFGRLKIPLPPGSVVVMADGKVSYPEGEIPWEEIFFRSSDRIRFRAGTLQFGEQRFENVEVAVSETELEVGGRKFPLSEIPRLEATTELLVIPREAMGLGDVKLMAGIGAFVGWRPIFFILMCSALLGSLVGLTLVLLRKREMQGKIPYGPYLALAAVIWLLAGEAIVDWYWSLSEPSPRF